MPAEDEDTAELEAAREELERALAETSRSLGVPMAEVERGTVLLERALRATSGGDYLNAMRLARDAGRVLPNWPPPQNTLAFAQFQLGKGDEAVAIAERVLAAHPDDVHALANLARFLTTLGRRDEALRHSDHLWSVLQAAEAFAILEQDDRVVGALERLPRDAVSDFGLILLGAALANLRRKGEALQVLEELQPNPGAARIAEALRRNETPPGGRFIALGPADLVPAGLMDRVLARLPRPAGGVGGEEADRAAVAAVLAQAPTFMPACMASLWLTDEVTSAQTVDLLLMLRTPEGVEAVRTFAFGRLGPDETRLYAALALREAGLVNAGRGLLLWQDGRYQELYPPRYRLIEADDAGKRPYPPAASKQMAKAVARHEAGDLEGAARLYRQVLAQDPTIEDAEQHLGLIDLMQGDRDAA